MKNDPQKLLFKQDSEQFCIFPHPWYTYINLTRNQPCPCLGKVKTQYICVVIMAKIFLVETKELLIRAEYIIQIFEGFAFLPEYSLNKRLKSCPL